MTFFIKKFLETYQKKNTKTTKPTIWELVTDIVLRRSEYAKTWDEAQPLVYMEFREQPELIKYYETLADPTMPDKLIDSLVRQTIRNNRSTIAAEAENVFYSATESADAFIAALRKKMPTLNDEQFRYIADFARSKYIKITVEQRNRAVAAKAAMDSRIERTGKKPTKEQIAQKKLVDTVYKGAFANDKTRTTWANYWGLSHITSSVQSKIELSARKIATAPSQSEADTEYNSLVEYLKTTSQYAEKQAEIDSKKPTPAQMFRDRILADIKPKTQGEADAIQKMVSNLFRIYKETNKSTRQASDPYRAIAEMVLNRAQYADVWNKAKELILERGAYEKELVDFIDRLADPTITKRAMDLVIAETIRQMKDAPAMIAKRYFLSGGESISEFMQLLRTNMPELDDASFKYLSDAITSRFKERMELRRSAMRKAIEKQFDETGGRIRPKTKSAIDKAVSQMMDAAAKNAFDFDPIRRAWAERLGLTALSQKAIDDIYKTMREISMEQDEDVKETLYYDMINRIGQEAEGTWYEKFLGLRRTFMLLNPTTFINNMSNNYLAMPFYKATDKMTALFDRMSGGKLTLNTKHSEKDL